MTVFVLFSLMLRCYMYDPRFLSFRLLIWEECYYEAYPTVTSNAMEYQGMSLQKLEGYHNGVEDRVHILVDKMMMSNQVNLVGEGLVGRAAFTGNHQWIVSGNCNEFSYPAEVLHEVNLQFSAGIKTIAVIPVIPHGVVQFGSSFTMPENVAFVHNVRSLIIQLGCVPSVFTSNNYIAKGDFMSGLPASNTTTDPFVAGSFNGQRNSSDSVINQSSNSLLAQFQDNLQVSASSFMVNNLTGHSYKFHGENYATNTSTCEASSVNPHNGIAGDRFTGDALMPLKCDSAMDQLKNNPGQSISFPQSSPGFNRLGHLVNVNGSNQVISSRKHELEAGISGQQSQSFQTSVHANKMFQDTGSSMDNLAAVLNTVENVPYYGNYNNDNTHTSNSIPDQDMQDVLKTLSKSQEHLSSGNFPSADDSFFQSIEGDDLFDVLGMDLRNKLLNCNDSTLHNAYGLSPRSQSKSLPRSMNLQNVGSGINRGYEGVSESGVFSSGSDHLLDAVISGVSSASRQTSDDSMSGRTSASKISTSSVPSTPHSNLQHPSPSVSLFSMGDSMQRQLLGLSRSVGGPLGQSFGPVVGKIEGGQTSSWIEQGPSTSVSTANSKKADEGGKTNRKRLKPGESPRPRPKDRQMIQDRVKELREIVPNGSKCSIDSLLERTIKHMLFLQSVTTHADKLKQMDSKVDRKEAGMRLKDNFEGGATWAFELGSQSMVCPIVVEDLNPPRQLLVEMLCEERGFFLEIADIIRGLGLTILKGVMEARNDKIWGRFAVEADRDVTRMEVFISLVHLLEQTLNSNNAPGNDVCDEKVVYPAGTRTNQQVVGPIVCGESSAM
ncbi:transcription factor LHW isoform X2 [Silene latifolia]|uniref:transcription factor LHW isoform X2 n=1 Tax=Silene latifolia TaxID=37657 RepID=UPI003D77994F